MVNDPYNDGYPRQCPRCGKDIHVPDPPHLCKDLRVRMERQERVIGSIRSVLLDNDVEPERSRIVAEAIYKVMRDGMADLP
jgi:hypothetical protein